MRLDAKQHFYESFVSTGFICAQIIQNNYILQAAFKHYPQLLPTSHPSLTMSYLALSSSISKTSTLSYYCAYKIYPTIKNITCFSPIPKTAAMDLCISCVSNKLLKSHCGTFGDTGMIALIKCLFKYCLS